MTRCLSTRMLRDRCRRAQFAAVRPQCRNQRRGQRLGAAGRLAVRETTTIEPVMDQHEAAAGRHRAEGHAVDRECADGRLERLGFEPLLGELDRRHRQAADDAEHVLAAEPSQPESECSQRQAVAAPVEARQSRHRRGVRCVEEAGCGVHEADELRPARRVTCRQASDRFERCGIARSTAQAQLAAVCKRRHVDGSRRLQPASRAASRPSARTMSGRRCPDACRLGLPGAWPWSCPPATSRRSSTSTFLPACARYAPATRPLWPEPTMRTSRFVIASPSALRSRRACPRHPSRHRLDARPRRRSNSRAGACGNRPTAVPAAGRTAGAAAVRRGRCCRR